MGLGLITRKNLKGVLLIFSLCALFDFVLGYFRGHSISTAVTSVVLGLLSTAIFFFFYRLSPDSQENKSQSDSNDR